MTFEASDPTVADVFACLWFAKVVARDLDISAVTDARERKQKMTAVVTEPALSDLKYTWLRFGFKAFSVVNVCSIIDATSNQF